jgi:hypothetical protein
VLGIAPGLLVKWATATPTNAAASILSGSWLRYRPQSTHLEKELGGTALFFSRSIGKVSPLGAQVSLLDPVAFTCFTKPVAH